MSLLLLFNQPPYYRVLLDTAQRLLGQNEPAIALVTAYMACEIYTEQVLSAAFAKRGIGDLEDAFSALLPGRSLNHDRVLDVYVALTGDRIQDEPFWTRFRAGAKLRNRAIPHGERVPNDEARMACEVAEEFVRHIDSVMTTLRQ